MYGKIRRVSYVNGSIVWHDGQILDLQVINKIVAYTK